MTRARSPSTDRHRPRSRGFTLVEMLVTVTALAILAAVTLPVLHGATVAYAEGKRSQRASGHAHYAIERVVRLVRELDEDTDTGAIGLDALDPEALRVSSGPVVRITGADLTIEAPGDPAGTLCSGVDRFELRYLDDAGAVTTDPALVHVIEITIEREGFVLTTRAFPRIRTT